ncbi:MAG: pentapeptide repeat-containing protein [Phormidesmis sp.]
MASSVFALRSPSLPLSDLFRADLAQTDLSQTDLSQTDLKETLQTESSELLATDSIVHPPLRQMFTAGDYQLVITAADQWETSAAIAQLYKNSTLQWQKPLPQHYGPRFTLISTEGRVLFVDEYINVASPYALMLLNATGEAVACYSFEDIQNTLDVSAADLTRQAISGWWVAAAPQLSNSLASDDQTVAWVGAGNWRIIVDLKTGELTAGGNLASY